MSENCIHQTSPGTLEEPAEYCENEAEDDSEYCDQHRPWHDDYYEDTRLLVGKTRDA